MAQAELVDFLMAGLINNSGNILAAGKVYTYSAGTTTPKTTYSAQDKSSSHANPIVLNANGQKQVWADGSYKFIIKDADDNLQYTYDNLFYGLQDGSELYGGVATGAANTLNVTIPGSIGSYTDGMLISFVSHITNTATCTLNVNGIGAKTVATVANEIIVDTFYVVRWDSTHDRWTKINLKNTHDVWQTWTPTLVGFSANPASAVYRYKQRGQNVDVVVRQPNNGTSNATTFTISLPVTAATISNMRWIAPAPIAQDNGAAINNAVASIASAATVIDVNTAAFGAWTAANGKSASFAISYEAA